MEVCFVCGRKEAPGEEAPCLFCFFSGRYFEQVLLSDERNNMLQKIRDIPQVLRAEVWHQGNGLFCLCIRLNDDRLILPGKLFEGQTQDGEPATGVMPCIPSVDDKWGVAVAPRGEDTANDLVFMSDEFSDDELVKTIEQMAEFNEMLTS